MRGREFLMKDAYSFHLDDADLEREYQNMRDTYKRIFTRIGVDFRIVKADTGAIGGDRSEEFQVLAQSGEDQLAVSDTSDYAANIEVAETRPQVDAAGGKCTRAKSGHADAEDLRGRRRAAEDSARDDAEADRRQGRATADWLRLRCAAITRSTRSRPAKHPRVAAPLTLATDAEIRAAFGCEPGFLGPIGDKRADHRRSRRRGARRFRLRRERGRLPSDAA